MATVSVLNTDVGLSGKTLLTAEVASTVTALITFDRDPSAPFGVTSGSAVVTNLDADKLDGLEGSAYLGLAAGGTVAGAVTFTLAPILTAGLKFPATQNAIADVNTLDDYEEGSWTPVIGGSGGTSGQTYGTQAGRYVKIGRLVVCTFTVTLTAKGTITGNAQIQGLPFTSDTTASIQPANSLNFGAMATNWILINALVAPNVTVATLNGSQAAATNNGTALTTTDIDNASSMTGKIIYLASA